LTSTLRNYVPLSSVEEFAENGENTEASTDLHSEDKSRKEIDEKVDDVERKSSRCTSAVSLRRRIVVITI